MEHFFQNIHGFFTYPSLYRDIIECSQDDDILVEVGVYHGRSLSFLTVEAINSGKKIQIYGVDCFYEDGVDMRGVYEDFISNTTSIKDNFTLIKKESVLASELFANESLSFVFLDGDHKYEAVREDIEARLPKIKKGGILAGHDYCNGWDGVDRAVAEKLGEIVSDTYRVEQCWLVRV